MTGVDPQVFDSFAASYDRFLDFNDASAWESLVAAGVTKGRRVLDAGCGSGRRCVEFADHFDEVVGIDLSGPLLDLARSRRSHPRVSYLQTDLMDFADPDGFDLVFSHTMLHHVPDLRAALAHLKALVRPGGTAVLADCVAPRPTPPAWVYWAGAVQSYGSDVRRHGWRDATWLFRFRTGGPWLAHLLTDRYLTPSEFDREYAAVFPGASFGPVAGTHAMTWHDPDRT
jgi:SAM-dependent methyltransferase